MQVSMDTMAGMAITTCHQPVNILDMDHLGHHIMMTGGMVVNMLTGTNRVEALGDGSGDLTSGTNTTTKDEGDDIIVGHSLLEVQVLTEGVDTRGGAIHDRPAVTTVAADQDGILTVGTAVVRQDGDGHIHEVGREEGEGVTTRMAEIEDETVRLERDHGIEAWFQRIDAIHMPVTTIVIK